MKIGFDLISDLNLTPEDSFNWEGKVTSLYCIVAGNVSTDVNKIVETLTHLGKLYQGVFYIMGPLEFEGTNNIEKRTIDILTTCRHIRNVAVLYRHVVIIDGIAVLAANGWLGSSLFDFINNEEKITFSRYEDIAYLKNSIEKLQTHLDVKKIVVVSSAVPHPNLYFGQVPEIVQAQVPMNICLVTDTQHKVSHWVYGTHDKNVDAEINNITYINNASYQQQNYWAKRFEVML